MPGMSNVEKLILRLMKENRLQPYDTISLAYSNYQYKHNTKTHVYHDIAPTLTTKSGGGVVVVE